MALMYRCDRCGKIYAPEDFKNKKYRRILIDKDLCPNCTQLLETFIYDPTSSVYSSSREYSK